MEPMEAHLVECGTPKKKKLKRKSFKGDREEAKNPKAIGKTVGDRLDLQPQPAQNIQGEKRTKKKNFNKKKIMEVPRNVWGTGGRKVG